jgi:4a-hydroxytetrahydrobiopterin dehydratase
VDVLDDDTVDAALAAGLAWERRGAEISKATRRAGFADALAYVNAVGAMAEEMDHHPEIDIRYNTVTLRLSTHSAGGLTRLDLELARRIDALDAGDLDAGDHDSTGG